MGYDPPHRLWVGAGMNVEKRVPDWALDNDPRITVWVRDEEFGEDFRVELSALDLPVVMWCDEHEGAQRFGDGDGLWVCPVAEQVDGAGRFCRIVSARLVRGAGGV